jgi:hypothetical protein
MYETQHHLKEGIMCRSRVSISPVCFIWKLPCRIQLLTETKEEMEMRTNIFKRTLYRGRKSLIFILIILCYSIAMVTLHFESVYADQIVTAKVKVRSWRTSGKAFPAPDEKGHLIAVGQREGEVDFDGKEKGKYETTAVIDGWIGKKGIYKGYSKYTFKDGSAIFFSWTAEGTRNKEGLPSRQGRGIIQKGTGRFEGIRGQAIFNATQVKPTSEDPTRITVTNAILVYSLP